METKPQAPQQAAQPPTGAPASYQTPFYVIPVQQPVNYPYPIASAPQPQPQARYYQQPQADFNINTPHQDQEKLISHPDDCDRPLGTYMDFLLGMGFGVIAPVFSTAVVFGMETSKISRLGNMFGTANAFMAIALFSFLLGAHFPGLIALGVIFLIAAIVMYVVTVRKFYRPFLCDYQGVIFSSAESVTVVSKVGERRDYWISFFFSFFLSVLGTLIRIFYNKSLQSRFGALKGLAWHLIIFGALFSFTDFGMHFLTGLILLQCTLLHFRRAFICARVEVC
jgi:hypothetical protein